LGKSRQKVYSVSTVIDQGGLLIMDKMGIGMLIVGIILVIAGIYEISLFWDQFVAFIEGGIGLCAVVIGILMAGIGVILVKD